MIYPNEKQFNILKKNYNFIPLVKEIKEFKDPFHLFKTLNASIILDSVPKTGELSRYSILVLDHFFSFRSYGRKVIICGKKSIEEALNPLDLLQEKICCYRSPIYKQYPFFTGGAVGYISYEIQHFIEELPNQVRDDLNLPELCFVFANKLVVFDHNNNKAFLVIGASQTDNYDRATDELLNGENEINEQIRGQTSLAPLGAAPFGGSPLKRVPVPYGELKSNFNLHDYEKVIKRAKEYIREGDIFQVNLAQRFETDFYGNSIELYEKLREINPSPFSFYADFGDFKLVSSSPERLLMKNERYVETRPIAGTYPKSNSEVENLIRQANFLLDEKERAEHIMLVDLERNDLGRVCQYGTVKVDELMAIEEYSHLYHLVSKVSGKLKRGKDGIDLIKAAFPGGTITGAPKIRAMEIINELEPCVRGPYTGSFGYISFNGNLDLNIIIRTFIIKENKAYIYAGAGIVADSNPTKEYYETVNKAQALIDALDVAADFSPRHKLYSKTQAKACDYKSVATSK